MTDEISMVSRKQNPVLIKFSRQSDYESNKTRIKRIIKIKHKLNKFIFATGEWYNEKDKDKSVVVKRFTDEKGYTNALLFKGSKQLVDEVKVLLDSLMIKYEEKEVLDKELPEQKVPPVVSKAPATEITPEDIIKLHKESEDHAFTEYATGRIIMYSREVERNVRSGLLDEEQAYKMKNEFSRKMGIFIHKWSDAGDKWSKERLAEIRIIKEKDQTEEGDLYEKPEEIEQAKKRKESARRRRNNIS